MKYRNSPPKFIEYSPMETLIPSSSKNLEPKFVDYSIIRDIRGQKKLPKLYQRENILLKKKQWEPAKVIKNNKYNLFIVKDTDGEIYRRNRLYLFKTQISYKQNL